MSVDTTGDLFGDVKRARARDPETSHEAAKMVDEFAARHHALIVAALRKLKRAGAEQIAGATYLDAYQTRKRLPELQRAGYVVVTDETRVTATGRRERIWTLAC